MKNLFGRLWAGYGMILMSVFILVYTPVSFILLTILGKRSERPILGIGYKVIARLISFLLLVRYKIKSKITVNRSESYVLISNHKSMIDVFASEVTSPVIFKFLGKKTTGKIPVWGWMIKRLCILIDRSSKASRNIGYKEMAKNLREGFSVFIYPEGTRNKTSQILKPFYNGAFRLAIEQKKSILVQTLIGSEKIIDPNKSFQMHPGKVTVYWDGPIDTKEYTIENLEELKEKVINIMTSHLEKHLKTANVDS